MMESDIIRFDMLSLDGIEKDYTLRPIMRREANWVFHTFVKGILKTLASGLDGLMPLINESSKGIAGMDVTKALVSLADASDAIDFDSLYDVANLLFAGGVIRSKSEARIFADSCTIEFAPIDTVRTMGPAGEDYFRDHPDELYIGVVKAVNANWPSVFISALGKMSALKAALKPSEGPRE